MENHPPSTMTARASGAQETRHGLRLVGAPLEVAAHDGLLLLAALTGHRGLLTAGLRFE